MCPANHCFTHNCILTPCINSIWVYNRRFSHYRPHGPGYWHSHSKGCHRHLQSLKDRMHGACPLLLLEEQKLLLYRNGQPYTFETDANSYHFGNWFTESMVITRPGIIVIFLQLLIFSKILGIRLKRTSIHAPLLKANLALTPCPW